MPAYEILFALPYPFSDHPSFPEGILKRALEREGFRVGVIETPFWQNKEPFGALGRPTLFYAIIAGPVDSIVLNYTSGRKRRTEDLYQINKQAYFAGCPPSVKYKIRPDRTIIVFANRIRELYPDVPIVIGGLEATLRCFTHFDFQQEKIRRSILLDSRADILVTGMGEKQIVHIAHGLRSGIACEDLTIPGTARTIKSLPEEGEDVRLPSHEEIAADKKKLLEAHLLMEQAAYGGKDSVQGQGNRYVIAHSAMPYTQADLDHIYTQPYSRSHIKRGAFSPALHMNLFSITSHRGCSGGCSFCSIGMHQGRAILSRTEGSILKEIRALSHHPQWKGFISDIGGATAEMYGNDCAVVDCRRRSCLFPTRCPLFVPGKRYGELLRACRKVPGVKKIFLGSGVRHDVLLHNPELLEEIMVHHSGRFLRIAPEHTEDRVLHLMRKPSFDVLESFVRLFRSINKRMNRKIELAPYIIVGHPGETRKDMMDMREKLTSLGLFNTSVQIFTPTPGTLSTAMYYAGCSVSMGELPVERHILELQTRKHLIAGM